MSCLIVLVRYDGVTVLAGLVQLLDQCMREGQESKASFGDFCLHEASACAARCNHVQLLDQCMREGQESRASFADFCFHGASACAAGRDHVQLLDQCMREGQESREHQRLQPDVITYSSLISACEKGKNPERAMRKRTLVRFVFCKNFFGGIFIFL